MMGKIISKSNLKNTSFEYELQAVIYHKLIEFKNETVEFQSSNISAAVTEYFNHIKCEFIIKGDKDKGNVKCGKLV